ncbi:CBO0543 family protein [Halalkalibacter okhensis]|uniref:Uncharacterized protein n=1 Tax=Halalkalibacter okhensis TaxID=333138 RepID=A0A0B0IJ49_9BACI|nr:CBO0543 family protein [Halalkalibacter okhensis]KHF40099.1 hypothetical protein LQ50_11330 [Halalkalibacter okhensis]
MRDRTLLHIITLLGISGWAFLFRKKGDIKDWFLIYLFKTLVSTLMDGPVIKKRYVQYPKRYFANSFDSNIVFLYILFPLLCVMYNQFTYKMKPIKTFFSVFLFSIPMALIENFLEKKTKLVEFRKGWDWYHTVSVLTATFWIVRLFIAGVRYIDKKRTTADNLNENPISGHS